MKFELIDSVGNFYKSDDLFDFNREINRLLIKPKQIKIIENEPDISINLDNGSIIVNGELVNLKIGKATMENCLRNGLLAVNFRRVFITKSGTGETVNEYTNFIGWKSNSGKKDIYRMISIYADGNWKLECKK